VNRIQKAASLTASLCVVFFWMLCTAAFPAELMGKKSLTAGDVPIVILSNSLEVDNKQRVVTFTGSVEARKDDMLIRCQKMFVYYTDAEEKKTSQEQKTSQKNSESQGLKIERIVAKGDVKIERTEGGVATAEEAVYYEDEEKVVLQGKPVVKQGEDYVEGSVITLFLKEDRSVVEGGGEQKVRAVLSPRSRKK
jgi:lipopolysaccharide export system protein LptA